MTPRGGIDLERQQALREGIVASQRTGIYIKAPREDVFRPFNHFDFYSDGGDHDDGDDGGVSDESVKDDLDGGDGDDDDLGGLGDLDDFAFEQPKRAITCIISYVSARYP